MKKIASIGILPFVSVALALYLYVYYFKGWLLFYLHHIMEIYSFVDYIVIGLTALFIYLIGVQLIEWNFNKKLTILAYMLYFASLIVLLFGKASHVQGFSFETFDFIFPFLEGNLRVITTGNILAFIPIGFLFYRWNFISTLLTAIILITLVESTQFILAVGFFDTGDIFLNVLGIMTGYSLIRLKVFMTMKKKIIKSQ
ncbi:VanZ family protein [Listeria sp. ILCC797]|uniref:VanZ family protein n=1 Tax=Listeria sp. ILCC797 TaxID=1918333 RepID=UPI000B594976|nr:VanZ family protein [Listeria sp. ILCC797]